MSITSTFHNQLIDIYTTTIDAYGDTTKTIRYSSVPCRFQENMRTIISTDRKEITTVVDVWIDGSYSNITDRDQIVKDSETYEIARLLTKRNIFGAVDHYRLYLV